MEPSHSETFSDDGEAMKAVSDFELVDAPETVAYTAEQIKELQDSLNWHAAILTVLLLEAGGVVEVDAKELGKIDLNKAKARISYDEEREVYTIEGLYVEDES